MKAKRILSLVLALLMVMALFVGCSGNGTTSTGGDTASTGGDTTGEPTTITFGSTNQFMTTPVELLETDVWKEIEKMANVEVEYTYYDSEKFNILLSGDELPDLIFSAITERLPDIIAGELALDLKPYLEKYKNIDSDPFKTRNAVIAKNYGGENEALYFLGDYMGVELVGGGVENLRGINARWDWYKEAGAPMITNIDEYVELLEKMVTAHPTTADGKKVYAMGVAGTGLTSWTHFGAFTAPSLSNPWTFGGYLYMESYDNGKLINGYTDTERGAFWTSMYFFNQLWQKGLLDPDSFTMTGDQRKEKSAAGQYAAECAWAEGDLYSAMKAEDPETLAGIVNIPNEMSLFFADYVQAAGYFPSYAVWVSAKTEKADAVLGLLDLMHIPETQRILDSGIEGVHWDYVDGVPTLKQETIDLRLAGGDDWSKTGIEQSFYVEMFQPSFKCADGYTISLFENDDMKIAGLTPLQKDVAEFYGVDYPAQAMQKIAEEGKVPTMATCFSELNQACTETIPTDIQRILTSCNDIVFAAIPELVQAADEAAYKAIQDRVLADLKAVGEETAWDWCLAANTAAQEFTKPLTGTIDWIG